MTGAGPAAQVVSPDVCFYSGTVVIEGIELLDVESNSTLTPIKGAPAPQRLDDRKPHTEPYAERQRETDAVIGRSNLEWRVLGIRPRTIDSRGVDRRIDEFRIGRLDNNALAFGRYPLLRIGPERRRRRSLVAKTLDRIHDVSLLHYDRVAQLLRPVQLFVHHPQDPRKRHQRLDAGIPRWRKSNGAFHDRRRVLLHGCRRTILDLLGCGPEFYYDGAAPPLALRDPTSRST